MGKNKKHTAKAKGVALAKKWTGRASKAHNKSYSKTHDKPHDKAHDLQEALKSEAPVEEQAGIITGDSHLLASPIVTSSSTIKHGVGEAYGSSDRSAHPVLRRLGVLMVTLVVLLVLATIGWVVLQKKQYNDLHKPERQAALYKQADAAADEFHDARQFNAEIATLESYLNTKPDDPYRGKAVLQLATALASARRYDEAISYFRSLESSPEHQIGAWRGLSRAYAAKNDIDQARLNLQKVVTALNAKGDPESKMLAVIEQVQLDAYKQ